jgi:hypothetical protein
LYSTAIRHRNRKPFRRIRIDKVVVLIAATYPGEKEALPPFPRDFLLGLGMRVARDFVSYNREASRGQGFRHSTNDPLHNTGANAKLPANF